MLPSSSVSAPLVAVPPVAAESVVTVFVSVKLDSIVISFPILARLTLLPAASVTSAVEEGLAAVNLTTFLVGTPPSTALMEYVVFSSGSVAVPPRVTV